MFYQAFPTWDSGKPTAQDGDTENFREVVRSKVYRARMCLADSERKWKWSLTSFNAEPLDALWAQMQSMDEEGKVLSGLCLPRGVVWKCRLGLMEAFHQLISDTVLATPFWYFARTDGDVQKMMAQARAQLLCMDAQMVWRFREHDAMPMKLAHALNLRKAGDEHELDSFLHGIWNRHHCCCDRDFTLKMFDVFPAWQRAKADPEWWQILANWDSSTRITNMHLERLLAQVRASSPMGKKESSPLAERYSGAGWLTPASYYCILPIQLLFSDCTHKLFSAPHAFASAHPIWHLMSSHQSWVVSSA